MSHYSLHIFRRACWMQIAFVLLTASVQAQVNDWINPSNGNWDVAGNWSAGLPNSTQSEVRIINANNKAVAINPNTPTNFPGSMTVQNLRLGGVAPNTNLLLLNFFGTTTPLRVLNTFEVEPNGRVLMLNSGLTVSNLNLKSLFEQEGGALVFSNSPANIMQIEGGHYKLTNGFAFGANMYLGGTNDGFVTASGLVQVNWLQLGSKPTVPGSQSAGFYVLQSGWLIVGEHEIIGDPGFGMLTQNGGTNSAPDLAVVNGHYLKNAGGLFVGELRVIAPSSTLMAPPVGVMTHAGGTAMVTNVLRVLGQGNSRLGTFNMFGGSLVTPRIQLEDTARMVQTNGTVNVGGELFINQDRNGPSGYTLSSGGLFTGTDTISASATQTSPSFIAFDQSGGTHVVTNLLRVANVASYRFSGGTLNAPNMNVSGNNPGLGAPAQFSIVGAPSYTITNQAITTFGSVIAIQDSAQQFGRLTIGGDTGINLGGSSAILRFGDSHTNGWGSQLVGVVPHLVVSNWNGSTNGGGADQLVFGSNSSGLTANQVAQIQFVNPAGFAPGTYSARILPTGEVVPMALPVLGAQKNGGNLVISWTGSFVLQSATNVAGPYFDVPGAASPYSANMNLPMQFFRLRN